VPGNSTTTNRLLQHSLHTLFQAVQGNGVDKDNPIYNVMQGRIYHNPTHGSAMQRVGWGSTRRSAPLAGNSRDNGGWHGGGSTRWNTGSNWHCLGGVFPCISARNPCRVPPSHPHTPIHTHQSPSSEDQAVHHYKKQTVSIPNRSSIPSYNRRTISWHSRQCGQVSLCWPVVGAAQVAAMRISLIAARPAD